MRDLDPNEDPVEIGGLACEALLIAVREAMGEIITIGDDIEDPTRPVRAFKTLQGLQYVELQLSNACEKERAARRERSAKERRDA